MAKKSSFLLVVIILFSFSCSKVNSIKRADNIDNLEHPDSTFLPIVFLCGQSNMEGVPADASLPAIFKDTMLNANVFYKPNNASEDDGSIESLKYSLNNNWRNPAFFFGPETGIAYYLSRLGHKVAIVKYAYGGSKLSSVGETNYGCWQVNSNIALNHYRILIDNWAKPSIVHFRKAGYKPYIAAFIWCQGETDAHDIAAANAYEANLRQLLNQFKKDMYKSDSLVATMRVIITRTRDSYPYSKLIRKAQENIASTYLNAYLIDSDQWPLLSDNIHYTSTTQAQLHGKAIADILTKIIP